MTGSPDYGPIVTGLIGLVLVGGFYLAIGTFASTLTDSQLIAFVITVLITGSLTIGMYLLVQYAGWLPGYVKDGLTYLNVDQQYSDFALGLIDIRNFVYFITGSAVFLFAAVKLLESRRWR
jgi:ABC-2 type transport system permease protein